MGFYRSLFFILSAPRSEAIITCTACFDFSALCQCYEVLLTRTLCTDFLPSSEGCTLCYSLAWLVSLIGQRVSLSCKTWLGWVVSFTSRPLCAEKEPVYPLNSWLGGHESRSGRLWRTEQKMSLLCVPCSLHSSDFIRFSKRPTNAHELMNVFLLRSNHRHVSATLCLTKIKRPEISYVPLRQWRDVELPS